MISKNCKNSIIDEIRKLKETKSAVMGSFEMFQMFVYNKFIKPLDEQTKISPIISLKAGKFLTCAILSPIITNI